MTMLAPLAEIWMPSPPDLRLFGAELSLVAAIVALLVLSMLIETDLNSWAPASPWPRPWR
jgi:hypothetical protein